MAEVPQDCLSTAEAEALILELARHGESLWANAADRIIEAMRVVGVRPAMIHAYIRTGLLITEGTRDGYTDEELRAWDQALREYFGTFLD